MYYGCVFILLEKKTFLLSYSLFVTINSNNIVLHHAEEEEALSIEVLWKNRGGNSIDLFEFFFYLKVSRKMKRNVKKHQPGFKSRSLFKINR